MTFGEEAHANVIRSSSLANLGVYVSRDVQLFGFLLLLQLEHLFAFSHRTTTAGLPDPGWHIYDPRKEFDRMGVLKPRRGGISPWRYAVLFMDRG